MAQNQNKWWEDKKGVGLIVFYLILTGFGIGISTGLIPHIAVSEDVSVPSYVYLYAFLGALAYIFTSLLTRFEKTTAELLKVGLRVPAALLLGAAVYLLITLFLDTPTKSIVAGLSFLIGLYVKLALEALGGIARRLLTAQGGSPQPPGR